MLAYVLALAVGLGSFALYMAAFFFPEVHRKNDFVWSGVGLFYALVLWVCAGRITGGLLLGQVASVALLGWSISQTLQLRRQVTPAQQQTELPSATEVKDTVQAQVEKTIPSVLVGASKALNGVTTKIGQTFSKSNQPKPPVATTATTTTKPPASPKVEVIDNRTPITESQSVEAPAPTIEAKEVKVAASTTEVTQAVVPPTPTETAEDISPLTDEVASKTTEVVQPVAPSTPTEIADSPEIAPPLTEEEAISQAVETALSEPQEPVPAQPVHPHPPDLEIVEAALKDAEEKHLPASPPEPEVPENPSPS